MRIARAASFLLVFFCFFSSGFSSASADDEGWNGKPSETPPAGMGTEAEPYLISCAAELAWFRDEVNSFNKDAHARLISDIDLNLSHNGQKWTAISRYSGVFDGGGHSVTGFDADVTLTKESPWSPAPLFSLDKGCIKNLCLYGSIRVTDARTGGGYNESGAQLAGLCYSAKDAVIADCIVGVDLYYDRGSSRHYAYGGGVVLKVPNGSCELLRVVNLGNIEGDFVLAGGLIGNTWNSHECSIKLSECANRGEINCGYPYKINTYSGIAKIKGAGGLIGSVDSDKTTLSLSRCYNAGAVSSDSGANSSAEPFCAHNDYNYEASTFKDLFFLKDSAPVIYGTHGAECATAEQFASGYVAYRLGMGQKMGKDDYPVPTGPGSSERVYKVGFCGRSHALIKEGYFNSGTPVADVAGGLSELSGYTGWIDENGNEVTVLSGDITLCGIGNTPPALCDESGRQIRVKPGRHCTLDLNTTFCDADDDTLSFTVSRDGGESVSVGAEFDFVPTEIGTYEFSFIANDGYEDSGEAFVFTVVCGNNAPVLAGGYEASEWMLLGEAYTLPLDGLFRDDDGDELSYKVSVNGGAYKDTGASYVFTPESAGEYTLDYTLSFKAYDGEDESEQSYTVTLTVLDGNKPWDGKTVLAPSAGDGTDEKPFKISTPEELAWLSANFKNKYSVILTADIDLNGKEWTPISAVNTSAGFAFGTFDGAGHTVSGMTINNQQSECFAYGLFGNCTLSCIKNLNVKGEINLGEGSGGGFYVGGLVGTASRITIEKCSTDVDITCTGDNRRYVVGGIAGAASLLDMKQCAAYGAIKQAYCAGGIVGRGGGIISDCYNTGDVYGRNAAGGLLGDNLGGAEDGILRCFNTGYVSGGNSIGAVVGKDYSRDSIWKNVYYLDDAAEKPVGEFGQYATVKSATALTAQEMKSSTFVETLNTAAGETVYREGKSNPVFTWLMPDVPTPAKGDIDGDGSITAADVSALAWALVDKATQIIR